MRKIGVLLTLFLLACLPSLVLANGHGVGGVRGVGHVGHVGGHVHRDVFRHNHVNAVFINRNVRFVDPGFYASGFSGVRGLSGACGSTYTQSTTTTTLAPQLDPGVDPGVDPGTSCPQQSYGTLAPSLNSGYGVTQLRTITSYQGVRGYFLNDVVGRRFFISGRHFLPIGHHYAFAGRLPRGVVGVGHVRNGLVVAGHRPGFALRTPAVHLRIR